MAAAPSWVRFARTYTTVLLTLFAGTVQAAEQRYDYDPLGRLVRSVDGANANEYIYDPAGNLLQVTGGAVQPPAITTGDLGDFRRNEYRQAAISGTYLLGATIRPSHGGITLDSIVPSATAISFRVAVAKDTPLGPHQLIVETAAGTASVGLNVVPAYDVTIEPLPIAVPPDNLARKFTVRLAAPASEDRNYTISTTTPTIAKTTTGSVNFLAGQAAADIGVIGVATGSTSLRISSASMIEPVEFLVSVDPGAGTKQIYSRSVGIARGAPFQATNTSTIISKSVSLTRGTPFQRTNDSTVTSKSVGITRGEPLSQSTQSLVVSQPVGITKP